MPALDTTVTQFDSTQAGAPTLTNSAGALITLLDACLVNGFGQVTCNSVVVTSGVAVATINGGHSARPYSVVTIAGSSTPNLNGEHKVTAVTSTTVTFDAFGVADGAASGTITLKQKSAGWEKQHSGTNLAAYRSANVQASRTVFRFDDTGTLNARVVGYTSMSDINNGVDPFPTAAQVSGGSWQPKSSGSGNRPWCLYASDRAVYFGVGCYAYYEAAKYFTFFGDLLSRKAADPYRGLLMMCTADHTANAQFNTYMPLTGGYAHRYMPRAYWGFGGAASVGIEYFKSGGHTPGGGGFSFPNAVDNALLFTRPLVVDNNAARGMLPGIHLPLHNVNQAVLDGTIFPASAGFARPLQYRWAGYSPTSSYGGFMWDVMGPW